MAAPLSGGAPVVVAAAVVEVVDRLEEVVVEAEADSELDWLREAEEVMLAELLAVEETVTVTEAVALAEAEAEAEPLAPETANWGL